MSDDYLVRDNHKFLWNSEKNRLTLAERGFDFELASHVYDDENALCTDDPYPNEYRYRTIGMVGDVCLFVVWTEQEDPDDPDNSIIRIISARRAGSRERRYYEEGIE